jgi:hypothetical protein
VYVRVCVSYSVLFHVYCFLVTVLLRVSFSLAFLYILLDEVCTFFLLILVVEQQTHIDHLFSPKPAFQLIFIIVCADKFVTVLSHSPGSNPLHILLNDLVNSIIYLTIVVVMIDMNVNGTNWFIFVIPYSC